LETNVKYTMEPPSMASPTEPPTSSEAEDTGATDKSTPVTSTKPLDPVTYIVLAYDTDSHQITRAELSAPPEKADEAPIPLIVALKGIYESAKFLPHLQELKNSGYMPVGTDSNMMILRQFEMKETISRTLENANPLKDLPESSKTQHECSAKSTTSTGSATPRRIESVFSGTRGKQGKYDWRYQIHHHKRLRRRERRHKFRNALKTMAGLGVVGAATLYVAGVMTEMKKVVVSEKESNVP
jgi:hypothetical protein